jgi:hypothetical protein
MRLDVLDRGHTIARKLLFRAIRLFAGYRVPDVAKMLMYRPEFFGRPMSALFQDVMRGPSGWSVGDRELMAAFVSRTNACAF